jgi:hypothetical protein
MLPNQHLEHVCIHSHKILIHNELPCCTSPREHVGAGSSRVVDTCFLDWDDSPGGARGERDERESRASDLEGGGLVRHGGCTCRNGGTTGDRLRRPWYKGLGVDSASTTTGNAQVVEPELEQRAHDSRRRIRWFQQAHQRQVEKSTWRRGCGESAGFPTVFPNSSLHNVYYTNKCPRVNQLQWQAGNSLKCRNTKGQPFQRLALRENLAPARCVQHR